MTSTVKKSILKNLFGRRKFPAVVQPGSDMASMLNAVNSIKERVEAYSGERGNEEDSFVQVKDLLTVGIIDGDGAYQQNNTTVASIEALEARIADLEARVTALENP